jgi:hypothetical protein
MTTMNMLAKKRAAKDNKREGNVPDDLPKPKNRNSLEIGDLQMTSDDGKPSHAGRGADYAYNSEEEETRRNAVKNAGEDAKGPTLKMGKINMTEFDPKNGDPNRSSRNASSDKSKRREKFRMTKSLLGYMDKMDYNGNGVPDDEE